MERHIPLSTLVAEAEVRATAAHAAEQQALAAKAEERRLEIAEAAELRARQEERIRNHTAILHQTGSEVVELAQSQGVRRNAFRFGGVLPVGWLIGEEMTSVYEEGGYISRTWTSHNFLILKPNGHLYGGSKGLTGAHKYRPVGIHGTLLNVPDLSEVQLDKPGSIGEYLNKLADFIVAREIEVS